MARMRRRQFLAAAGASIAAAACGRGSPSGSSTPPAAPSRSPTRVPSTATSAPSPRVSPSPAATPRPVGGVARLESPRTLSFDTFEAARTGDLSTLEILGRTHSRLFEYEDFESFNLRGDLVRSREQPDPLTLVVRLQPAAAWQATDSFEARSVTAADVAAMVQGRIAGAALPGAPSLQRAHDWLSFAGAVATADDTVQVSLARPDPFAMNTLAGAFAFVQSPEVVEALGGRDAALGFANLAGSGPFAFDRADDDGFLLRASDRGHRKPHLDGLHLASPSNTVMSFTERRAHQVTAFDRRDAATLAADPGGESLRFVRPSETPILSTMFVGAPPWDDIRLREAIVTALHPQELTRRLVAGRARPIPIVLGAGQLPLAVLERELPMPVTLADARVKARALWDDAGGPALGTVNIDFPNVFDPRFSASSTVIDMLSTALGDQFRAAVEPYTTIAEKSAARAYGNGSAAFWFGWGPPLVDPVPERHLYETYSSHAANFAATGFVSPELDAILDRMAAELDPEQRADLVREAVGLIAVRLGGGILPWFTQLLDVFRWSFFDRIEPTMWWDQHLDLISTIDTSNALYREFS
jgi:ABC-type transport system substrate-binding protein